MAVATMPAYCAPPINSCCAFRVLPDFPGRRSVRACAIDCRLKVKLGIAESSNRLDLSEMELQEVPDALWELRSLQVLFPFSLRPLLSRRRRLPASVLGLRQARCLPASTSLPALSPARLGRRSCPWLATSCATCRPRCPGSRAWSACSLPATGWWSFRRASATWSSCRACGSTATCCGASRRPSARSATFEPCPSRATACSASRIRSAS
jgi:hypothetical protein